MSKKYTNAIGQTLYRLVLERVEKLEGQYDKVAFEHQSLDEFLNPETCMKSKKLVSIKPIIREFLKDIFDTICSELDDETEEDFDAAFETYKSTHAFSFCEFISILPEITEADPNIVDFAKVIAKEHKYNDNLVKLITNFLYAMSGYFGDQIFYIGKFAIDKKHIIGFLSIVANLLSYDNADEFVEFVKNL